MEFITILTTTYNRAQLIGNLYQSLENQSDHDFKWLIVDDGSKDNTKEIVDELQLKSSFPIEYIYKDNGGKHTALNIGIKQIQTELTIIVDSDDILLPDAISSIRLIHDKYKENTSIGAYSFLKCYPNGEKVIGLDRNEFVASYIKYRISENRPGDMAEVFKTEVLKEFPFPEFEGERFLSEDVVWIQIGLKYLYVFINKAIYQCEYLQGGLTDNDKPMKFASPLGSMLRGKMLMTKECGLIANVKGAIIYDCYKRKYNRKVSDQRLHLTGREKSLCLITKGVSLIFYKKWERKS